MNIFGRRLVIAAILFCGKALADCPDIAGTWKAATFNGNPVSGSTDLKPMTITQNGCVVHGSFLSSYGANSHTFDVDLNRGRTFTVSRDGPCGHLDLSAIFVSVFSNFLVWHVSGTSGT